MKHLLSLLLVPILTSTLVAGGGPGPWSDGAYYPGGLNGKYVGIVTGQNISGVLGFAIVDGAPPFRTTEVQRIEPLSDAVERNIDIAPDVLQNYFAIFVEGRTYSGVTYAGIDIDANKVAGSLSGRDPIGVQAFTAADATVADSGVNNSLPIVNRGLSGGFTAKIKKKQAVFTFKGDGQLSTPANPQTVSMTTVPIVTDPFAPPPPVLPGTVTNQTSTGSVTTQSTAFNISGIRTSFAANNPTAQADELAASGADGAGGAGGGN